MNQERNSNLEQAVNFRPIIENKGPFSLQVNLRFGFPRSIHYLYKTNIVVLTSGTPKTFRCSKTFDKERKSGQSNSEKRENVQNFDVTILLRY